MTPLPVPANRPKGDAGKMLRAIAWHWASLLLVAVLVGGWFGPWPAGSVVLGGAAYALPNTLFVVRQLFASRRPGGVAAAGFVVGELLKLIVAVLLLWLIAQGVPDLSWPAYLLGLLVALKMWFFAMIITIRH